jgi:peptidyl-prolyl cis-trans isomerase C
MYKLTRLAAAVLAALSLATTALAADAPAAADNPTLVTINGTALTLKDFNNYARLLANANPPPEAKNIMRELINRELLVQAAKTSELEKEKLFQEKMDELRYGLMSQYTLRRYVEDHPVSEDQIKADYERRIKEIPIQKEYKARHILLDSEDEAKAIAQELKQGKNFEELAKEKSLDKSSGAQGGDLGWFKKDAMVKPFSDAVAALEKGKLSDPVQSNFGWHVILLEDARDGQPEIPAFDTVKDRIKQLLQMEMAAKYVDELRNQAKIEVTEAGKAKEAEKPAEKPQAPAGQPKADKGHDGHQH